MSHGGAIMRLATTLTVTLALLLSACSTHEVPITTQKHCPYEYICVRVLRVNHIERCIEWVKCEKWNGKRQYGGIGARNAQFSSRRPLLSIKD